VGLSFITGSISAPGLAEASEYWAKDNPWRALFVRQAPGAAPEAAINLTLKRGVRATLEYTASGDIAKARAATNPGVAPHLEFVDMAGHGYAVVSAGPDRIDTEFVCTVRPVTRATTPDGGPLRYRVSHQARRRSWSSRCLRETPNCRFGEVSRIGGGGSIIAISAVEAPIPRPVVLKVSWRDACWPSLRLRPTAMSCYPRRRRRRLSVMCSRIGV